MLGHPEARGMATKIFGKKSNFRHLSKLCLLRVADDLDRLFKNFSDMFGQLEGRGSATPIFSKNYLMQYLMQLYDAIANCIR